jgi:hypothetical protein
MIGLLKDLVYIYKYKKIITSDMNNSHNYSKWRAVIPTIIVFRPGPVQGPGSGF